jgi:ADP-heptose:LPS heptosyltransferase
MRSFFPTTQIFTRNNHPSAIPGFVPPEFIEPFDPAKIQKKTLSEHIRHNFFRALGGRSVWERPTSLIDGHSLKRILLFRYDAIGDFIVSTPVIRWLATALPGVEIDILTSYRNDSLISNDPFVSHTVPIHPGHNMHKSWIEGIRRTRPRNYDLILGLVFTRMTKCALLARAIAPRADKITILHNRRQHTYGLVFNRQIPHYDWLEHWAITMLRVVTDSISPVVQPPANVAHPYIALEEKSWRSAIELLQKHGLGYALPANGNVLQGKHWQGEPPQSYDGHPYGVINISAFTKNRQWNSEACIAVCRELLTSYGNLRLFVTGAPDARQAIVAGCSFLISPDTATLHMAAAADKPIVGLYAEYIKIAEWYPFTRAPFVLLLSTNPHSINAIETDKIIEATHQLITEAQLTFSPAG